MTVLVPNQVPCDVGKIVYRGIYYGPLVLVMMILLVYYCTPLEHRHRIDQIPKPIAVENINTRHLVEKYFINSRIFHIFSHHIDQILE